MTFRDDVSELLRPHLRASADVDALVGSIEDLFISDFDCGVAHLRVQVDQLKAQLNQLDRVPGTCRACGCTQDDACVSDGQPCWWVLDDLCSACAPAMIARSLGMDAPVGDPEVLCCSRHVVEGAGECCDPDDCAPCCPDCPRCPTWTRIRSGRIAPLELEPEEAADG